MTVWNLPPGFRSISQPTVFHGAGVNITVMSNNGRLHVGVIACRESMPDVEALVRHFPSELAHLQAAVRAQETVTPITTKARSRKKAAAASD